MKMKTYAEIWIWADFFFTKIAIKIEKLFFVTFAVDAIKTRMLAEVGYGVVGGWNETKRAKAIIENIVIFKNCKKKKERNE